MTEKSLEVRVTVLESRIENLEKAQSDALGKISNELNQLAANDEAQNEAIEKVQKTVEELLRIKESIESSAKMLKNLAWGIFIAVVGELVVRVLSSHWQ